LKDPIEIFVTPDGSTTVEVRFEGETFWLSLSQIADLFSKDKSVISRHLKNIYQEGELTRESTVAKNATVRLESTRAIKRDIEYYNLDAILSVGYRVNSLRGTQFRQWATRRLKEYLEEGVAINERRLEQKGKELRVLHDGIRILSRTIEHKTAAPGGFEWIDTYRHGLKLLDDYDQESLDLMGRHTGQARFPSLNEYLALVEGMRSEFKSEFFGRLKDSGFESALQQVGHQLSGGDAYPSIEEKAAMLLYLVVKNHAFVDGNKRIAAACFLLFLERNGLLYGTGGGHTIGNEALAGLTLFAAVSHPDEMETVKRLLVSVLNRSKA
jgi:hypothetical protein